MLHYVNSVHNMSEGDGGSIGLLHLHRIMSNKSQYDCEIHFIFLEFITGIIIMGHM